MMINNCKHCGDDAANRKCPVCKKEIEQECIECHQEVAHGIIKNQNIHIVGGSKPLCSVEDDPDAYSPSWKAGN